MKFEIDFNRERNDQFLIEKLGAKVEYTKIDSYLFLEVRDFNHLEEILKTVKLELNDDYSAVISFDPPTIYLDDKI